MTGLLIVAQSLQIESFAVETLMNVTVFGDRLLTGLKTVMNSDKQSDIEVYC